VLGEDVEVDVEGRAIIDNEDYLFSTEFQKEDAGFFKAGFRQFRTWYDASGGYNPAVGAYFNLFDNQLGLDRGEAWAEGGLELPSDFELTVAYRHLYREGTKSSIIWGESGGRGIVPAFQNIDESRHIISAALKRQTEATTLGAALRYETDEMDNRRHATRRPGEAGVQRSYTQRDNSESDVFGARAHAEQRLLEDRLILSGAYAYNDLDLDHSGSRIYGFSYNPTFDPLFPNRQQRDEGFFNLNGSSELVEHVGNANASWRPLDDLHLIAGLRLRGQSIKGSANFDETNVGAAPTFTTAVHELLNTSRSDDMSWAESVEARYTGLKNLVLHARGDWEQSDGDIREQELDVATAAIALERDSDIERRAQNYAAGFKWYPHRKVNLSSEYAYRERAYDWDHNVDSTANPPPSADRYPAYFASQDFKTHNVGVRSTVSLPANIRLVGRYDYRVGTVDTRADGLNSVESAEIESHLVGTTATWNPNGWTWLRAGANYVLSQTDTSANDISVPGGNLYPAFDNDYVTAEFAAGAALDAKTDGEVRYHYFGTDNYKDISAFTQPFGSKSDEHGVSLGIVRHLTDNAKLGIGYGFFNNDEALAGGFDDYRVHIVTTSVELTY
jgi:hypothetical protein